MSDILCYMLFLGTALVYVEVCEVPWALWPRSVAMILTIVLTSPKGASTEQACECGPPELRVIPWRGPSHRLVKLLTMLPSSRSAAMLT